MTWMYGYAIAAAGPLADHTWVYTDDGFCCACCDLAGVRGCSENDRREGHIICESGAGEGDFRRMAGPYETTLFIPTQCGVVYAINGVCHQMANRILLATSNRVDVGKAAGSTWSYFTYGRWGTLIPLAAFEINA